MNNILFALFILMAMFLALARLPPCQTEDGDWCYWDAKEMGNGKGQSSISINGLIIPYGPVYK